MIKEEDIREFHGIIARRTVESELDDDGKVQYEDDNEEFTEDEFVDTYENGNSQDGQLKNIPGNTLILYLAGIFGLIIVISVIIGAFIYIYNSTKKGDTFSDKIDNDTQFSRTWNFPGYQYLITDPEPHEEHIKVWFVRTAVPPQPQINIKFDATDSSSEFY